MRVVSTFRAGPVSMCHHASGKMAALWEDRAPERQCALFNGSQSTLAMLPETNLVWTVLRARGSGNRDALREVRG